MGSDNPYIVIMKKAGTIKDKSVMIFRCGHRFHKNCILEINNPTPQDLLAAKEVTA